VPAQPAAVLPVEALPAATQRSLGNETGHGGDQSAEAAPASGAQGDRPAVPYASPRLEEVGITMSSADLSAWASNFSVLGGMLDDYETEVAHTNPLWFPNRGTGQLVAFQYGTALGMLGLALWVQKPSWLDEPEFGPTAGTEHKLLASHYVLSAIIQYVDDVPLNEARAALRDLADRLSDTAAQWAEDGVNPAEVEQIRTERKELARRAATTADQ
jgi:hypothetical protein